jgi:tetratricopeptide (TPR) repeat protein
MIMKPGTTNSNRLLAVLAIVIIFTALAIYFPTLSAEYIYWDDTDYVLHNTMLKTSVGEFVPWAFKSYHMSNWHPLTWISYFLDHYLWDTNPTGYLLTNMLLHIINSLLVMLLFTRLFTRYTQFKESWILMGGAFMGMAFVVHPFHIESVAWIAERKDLLYSLFWILCFHVYLSYAHKRSLRLYALLVMLFILSLLSKPMAITLPAVLLIADFFPLRRLKQIKLVTLEKIPLFMLSAGSAYMTVSAHKTHETMNAINNTLIMERSALAMDALWFYISRTFIPVGFGPFYPLPQEVNVSSPAHLGLAALFVALAIVAIMLWKRVPIIIAAYAYFIVTLSPVIGIIQVGQQAYADRYMYMPILAPLSLAVVGGMFVASRGMILKKAVVGISLIFLLALSIVSTSQVKVWNNEGNFWLKVNAMNPNEPASNFFTGKYFYRNDMFEQAIEKLDRSLKSRPFFGTAHYFRGMAKYKLADTPGALEDLRLGIAYSQWGGTSKNPNLVPINKFYEQRAEIYLKEKEYDKALADLKILLDKYPESSGLHYKIYTSHLMMGQYQEALKAMNTVIEFDPSEAGLYSNRGNLYLELGQREQAITDYQKAASLGYEPAIQFLKNISNK